MKRAVRVLRRLVPMDTAILNDLALGPRSDLELLVACHRSCSPFVMEKDVKKVLKLLCKQKRVVLSADEKWRLVETTT